MKGLEAAEIPKSQLNEELRYEAQFFQKNYLAEDSALERLAKRDIGSFARVTDGPHGYHVVDKNSSIVMLTAKNAKDWFTDREDADPIAERIDAENRRSSLKADDVILSTRGTVGMCALVIEESPPANIDQDVARITWLDRRDFLPEFVVAYLNSRFGQDYITRHTSGMVQQGLSLEKVRRISIPMLSHEIQEAIAKTIQDALKVRREAAAQQKKAQQVLLNSLGLENWQPPAPLTYTRRASEASAAGRLDAEFFSPAYNELFAIIHRHGAVRLGDIVLQPVRRGISPEYIDDGDLLVINSQHVGKTHLILDNNRTTRRSLLDVGPDRARSGQVRRGDVLLNSTGRITIGRCQCVLDDITAVVDNHVAIIRPGPELDPVYLACFLNVLPGLMQTERCYTGSSGQIELRPDLVEDYLIWKAPYEIQLAIRTAIESAHAARQDARILFDRTKHAVEIAIEASGEAAIRFLKESEK